MNRPIIERDFDLRSIEVFLSVAETGSFRRASLLLGVSQSSISRRVQRMEDSLGVSLFERRSTGAMLTNAGRKFANRTRIIFRDFRSAIERAREAGSGVEGELRVGVAVSLSINSVCALLKKFRDNHSEVEVCFCEGERGELLSSLSHRKLDVIITAGELDPVIGDSMVFGHERILLAINSEHDLLGCENLDWKELEDLRFFLSSRAPGSEIYNYLIKRVGQFGKSVCVQRHLLGCEGVMSLVGLRFGASGCQQFPRLSVSKRQLRSYRRRK